MSRLFHLIVLPVAILVCAQAVTRDALAREITVDGELHVEEWQEGADQDVTDQGWVRMFRHEDGLYLAIRTNAVGMIDVQVMRGDTLYNLHASGQVGGAVYQRGEDGLWKLERSYPWYGKEPPPKMSKSDLKARLGKRIKENKENPPPSPSPAEYAETVAKHLETAGWTASLFNMGDSKTAEYFLSADFLQSGDRILVTWPYRNAEKQFDTVVFPEDATGIPSGHSPGMESEPFAMTAENWYVFK